MAQYIARTDIGFPGRYVESGTILDDADLDGHDTKGLLSRGAIEALHPSTVGLPPEKPKAKRGAANKGK